MSHLTLIERAKALLADSGARKAAASIVPLALAAAAHGQLSDPSSSGIFGSGGGNPTGFSINAGLANGNYTLKMWGGLGPNLGSDWTLISGGQAFDFHSQAHAFPIAAGTTVRFDWDFTLSATGGTVTYSLLDGASGTDVFGNGQFFSNSFSDTGTGHIQGTMSTEVTTDIVSGGGAFQDLYITWTGYDPGDTLTVSIPQSSLDTTLVPVPEPTTVVLLGGGLVSLLSRRRRTRS